MLPTLRRVCFVMRFLHVLWCGVVWGGVWFDGLVVAVGNVE